MHVQETHRAGDILWPSAPDRRYSSSEPQTKDSSEPQTQDTPEPKVVIGTTSMEDLAGVGQFYDSYLIRPCKSLTNCVLRVALNLNNGQSTKLVPAALRPAAIPQALLLKCTNMKELLLQNPPNYKKSKGTFPPLNPIFYVKSFGARPRVDVISREMNIIHHDKVYFPQDAFPGRFVKTECKQC